MQNNFLINIVNAMVNGKNRTFSSIFIASLFADAVCDYDGKNIKRNCVLHGKKGKFLSFFFAVAPS